jgi:endoglucanase
MNAAQQRRLFSLLSQPTAPFREQHVMREIERQLARTSVPYFYDPHGNIVLGVASAKEYRSLLKQNSKEPVRLFIAHMDHPGFHVTKKLSPTRYAVKWHGGTPYKHVNGSKVWLANSEQQLLSAVVRKASKHKRFNTLESAEIVIDRKDSQSLQGIQSRSLFGGFEFNKPVKLSGRRVYTRAADDLVGVFAILETARKLFNSGRTGRPAFIGLLTRGEEVGFVGAVAHFELGWLKLAKRQIVAVSLEASRTLPGALIGKGPVVRLGDRRTVFHAGALQVLTAVADKVLKTNYQRRVMDGGACEATAATAWGIPTVGITIPLGNYHNQGLDGGIECPKKFGPAPEFVHLDDIEGELKLCAALMRDKLGWSDAWSAVRTRLQKNLRAYARHLKS